MSNQNELHEVKDFPKNLKGIYARLLEIDEILYTPKHSLDTIVNGDIPNGETSKKDMIESSSVSIENFTILVDRLGKTANGISSLTRQLVGN